MTTHHARSLLRALPTAIAIGTLMVGPVAAHSQTVRPPSHDEPVVSGPISNPWAQAHCHATSPTLVADRSNGVVSFTPATVLACPAVPNPGGRVHGD